MELPKILILDYSLDKSETALVKRWLSAKGEISSLFIDTEESVPDSLIEERYTHVIHTGSALSITEQAPFTEKIIAYIRHLADNCIPQMGICYGHQLLCRALAGIEAVRKSPRGYEVGWQAVRFYENAVKIPGVGKQETVWQSHFDEVIGLPEGSEIVATNEHTEIQAFINTKSALFGTQFHPEFDREEGNKYFIEKKEVIENHNYDFDTIVNSGPSIDTGTLFFGFFFDYFTVS